MTFFQSLSQTLWERSTISFVVPTGTGTTTLSIFARVRQTSPSPYAVQRLESIGTDRESVYLRGWYEEEPTPAIRAGRKGRILLWDGSTADWFPDGQQEAPFPLIGQIAGVPISGWARF